jgi:hypothetical protein
MMLASPVCNSLCACWWPGTDEVLLYLLLQAQTQLLAQSGKAAVAPSLQHALHPGCQLQLYML